MNKMKNKEKELNEELEIARRKAFKVSREVSRIEEKLEQEIQIPQRAKLVGKCYKYRNFSSCPEKESDYWWLYKKNIGMKKTGDLITEEFQIDKDGNIEIKLQDVDIMLPRRFGHIPTNWIEIKPNEYEKARKALIKRILNS